MKIGIVGAMAQEVEILVNLMTDKIVTKLASGTIYEGNIQGKQIVLLQSGIGKVAAAMGTTALLQLTQPDLVINTGSAGGVAEGLKVGDVIVSTETQYHDADVTAFGYAKGQLPACPVTFVSDTKLVELVERVAPQLGQHVKRGLICSGDSFIQGGERLAQIKQDFPKVPCVVVRAISDAGDGKANMSFEEFLPLAAKQSSDMIVAILAELN